MIKTNFDKQLSKGQIQACIISQNNEIVYEYFKNSKAKSKLHPIHSCTKSIVSILFGICMKKGLITDLDMPIYKYFPQYKRCFTIEKEQITLKNLLTMSAGLDWPEFGIWNFGTPMEYSKDMISFILERDISAKVGSQMIYNSGCSNLLSSVIQTVTNTKLVDFANDNLFSKLGIGEVIWHEKQGICLGANGLKMKPYDMLKIGNLYLDYGICNNSEIIHRDWVENSTKPYFLTYNDIGSYGYHWWVSSIKISDSKEIFYYFAMGLFGQFIINIPEYKTTIIFVSGNYGETIKPMSLIRDNIVDILNI